MWQKIYFVLVIVFFLLMNAFLWRSEFGNRDLSVRVPVESVTRRLVGSADDSNLEIRHHGVKIGYCRWSPGTLSAEYLDPDAEEFMPEGMVDQIEGYVVDLSGNVALDQLNRLRFNYSLQIDTNYVWKQMHLRLIWLPLRFEVQSFASAQTLNVTIFDGDREQHHSYKFSELKNPESLLRAFGNHFLGDLFNTFGIAPGMLKPGNVSLGLEWEAHTDRRKIGSTFVPVYRLQAPLLDQYRVVVDVLESGEILRVELPDEVELINDNLLNM
jgi:hypothetical protein